MRWLGPTLIGSFSISIAFSIVETFKISSNYDLTKYDGDKNSVMHCQFQEKFISIYFEDTKEKVGDLKEFLKKIYNIEGNINFYVKNNTETPINKKLEEDDCILTRENFGNVNIIVEKLDGITELHTEDAIHRNLFLKESRFKDSSLKESRFKESRFINNLDQINANNLISGYKPDGNILFIVILLATVGISLLIIVLVTICIYLVKCRNRK